MSMHSGNISPVLFNLCRAISKENGEKITGYYCRYGHTTKEKVYVIPTGASALYAVEVVPDSIERCACIYDGKGEMIYEGDVVQYGEHKYQVIYELGAFLLYDKDGEMISKIGGDNDHGYPIVSLFMKCEWINDYAEDIIIIRE